MVTGKTNSQAVKIGIILASVLMICVISACAPAAYASPAYVVESGRAAADVAFSTQGRAILTRADVTISAPVFPDKYGFERDSTDTSVAEYTFSNDSDTDDTVAVLFRNHYPGYNVGDDVKKISVDGKALAFIKKYAPVSYGREDERIYAAALSSQYDPDADIPSDERVFVQTFTVSSDIRKDVKITVDGENAVFADIDKSTSGIYVNVSKGRFRLVTVGKPYDECGIRLFYDGAELNPEDHIVGTSETAIKDYFYSNMTDVDEAAKEDLYACYIAKTARADDKLFCEDDFFCGGYEERVLAEFVVPAGGIAVFKLEEYFFPGIDEDNTPTIYPSSVSVPNADRAENFEMNVNVVTPYYVLDNDSFLKTDDGYAYASVGSDETAVRFTLCKESKYSEGRLNLSLLVFFLLMIFMVPIMIVLFILGIAVTLLLLAVAVALPVAAVVGIVMLIIWLCRRKKGKKKDDFDPFDR